MKVEFCGAFIGTATMRPGETAEQFGDRITAAMLGALDARCKRLGVNLDVDRGELVEAIAKARTS